MKHSFEVKLAAVNHYLAGHAGIISTAKLFQLSHTSLSHWINPLDCRRMLSGILSLYPGYIFKTG